jgi:hypothetical protein
LFSEFHQKLELGRLKYLFSVRVELPHIANRLIIFEKKWVLTKQTNFPEKLKYIEKVPKFEFTSPNIFQLGVCPS